MRVLLNNQDQHFTTQKIYELDDYNYKRMRKKWPLGQFNHETGLYKSVFMQERKI